MILNLDKLTKHGLECEPKSRKWVSAANRHNYVQDLLVDVLEMLVPLVGIYELKCDLFLIGKSLF